MEANVLSVLALSSLMAFSNPAEQSVIGTYQLPAIAGLWEIELEDRASCREYYNFGKDSNLTTTSGGERTTGEYRFTYVDELSLPVLAIKTEYDNNQPDCSGNQIDQSGNTFAVFVKLDARHDPKHMQWCNDPDGKVCTAKFRRILP